MIVIEYCIEKSENSQKLILCKILHSITDWISKIFESVWIVTELFVSLILVQPYIIIYDQVVILISQRKVQSQATTILNFNIVYTSL